MKKLKDEVVIAKIRLILNKYYEDVGRGIIQDIDERRQDLIDEIEIVLEKANIDKKILILEQFKLDEK